ncbi:MAG: sensor histidine kinase [bacterium]|nr:sensor histidine kinase [bacterium]
MAEARSAVIGDRLRVSSTRVSVIVAVLTFVAAVVNLSTQATIEITDIPIGGFVLLALGSAGLLWWRSRPLAVFAVSLVMTLIWLAVNYPGNPVFHILVSLYAVGRYVREWRISWTVLALAIGATVLGLLTDDDPVSGIVAGVMVTTLPWYVGRRIRLRREAARERAELLEWKRTTEAQRAVADARAGIARELHDVVAHSVSLMTVQAGVARLLVVDDPDRAREAIGAVEGAGREALDELRHLLGVLRPEGGSDELTPQPALNQVHKLVDRLGQTGMEVSLNMDVWSELPVRTDLFAYRIVQEALTNVLKHGGADATTHVRLEEADGYLDIEVADSGTGTTTLLGSGRGIMGMQERAVSLGGTFEAGPRPEGGFRVVARLPIGDQ